MLRSFVLLMCSCSMILWTLELFAAETYKQVRGKNDDWHIIVPSDWTVENSKSSPVLFTSPDGLSVCGVHWALLKEKKRRYSHAELKKWANEIVASQSWLKAKVVRKTSLILPSGENGVRYEVSIHLAPGGKSLRLYTASNGKLFTVDCETFASLWENRKATYFAVIGGFDFSH